jgi:hypothetical protein
MQYPRRMLTLAFVRPGVRDPALNRLVAYVCKHGICHVELVFEDNMAFSINAGQKLFFRPRTLSNPEYELVTLSVSQSEYTSAYRFCNDAVEKSIGFTDFGMLASYFQPRDFPCINSTSSLVTGHTFCSKIVTEALQFANVQEAESLTPCTTTPSGLYEAVKDSHRKLIFSVPYKCEQLRHCGVISTKCGQLRMS